MDDLRSVLSDLRLALDGQQLLCPGFHPVLQELIGFRQLFEELSVFLLQVE